MNKVLIIAEAGVNHNGSLQTALQLVEKASEAGADIVKFQTFCAPELASKNASQAEYQQKNTQIIESQLDMLRRLELPKDMHYEIQKKCKSLGIEFLSTPFDIKSLLFLCEKMQLQRIKLPSGELTNAPLILASARTQRNVIVSTGMATVDEIKDCLKIIAFGYLAPKDAIPNKKSVELYFNTPEAQKLLKRKVTLLHCTTEYPAPKSEVNLTAMETMQSHFDLPVGYSDHTEGLEISFAAVAMGAKVIEKHFTLNRNMDGPDHKASIEPEELKSLVTGIRNIESALGNGEKKPSPSEIKNIDIARKSLIASTDIIKGEHFTSDNIAIKRPGSGISPMKYWEYLGKKSEYNFKEGDLIK